uniref:non-specific serine/threonine protein kinase n=1 Tax=Neobodo designis TaxID=312471 RepID=A0A7S1M015_NEODS|mmetsp:Transcript_31684/g.97971  ORF Transcript_31684/g.97971 Transcript_31684/m.97971 type:complete len:790 (+) Transcript_31684:46-2415(+)
MRTAASPSNSPSKPARKSIAGGGIPAVPALSAGTASSARSATGSGGGTASSVDGGRANNAPGGAGNAVPSPHVVYGELGRGDGSVVLLAARVGDTPSAATDDGPGLRAVKLVNKLTAVRRRRSHRVETEYRLFKELRPHPFIVRCFGAFQTPTAAVFELELCTRGTLRDLLHILPANRLEDAECRRHIVAVVLTALRYLHLHGWVYRDLKPDNVLVRGDGSLCLSDFDLSTRLESDGFARRCTPAAPPSARRSSSHFVAAGALHRSRLSAESTDTAATGLQNTPPLAPVVNTPGGGAAPLQDSFGSIGARPSSQHRRHGSGRSTGSGGGRSPLPARGKATASGDGLSLYQDPSDLPPTLPPPLAAHGSLTRQSPVGQLPGPQPPSQRRRGSFVGTPAYMAPEVVSGSARQTAAVDMWGLGCLLYELTFGVAPFVGASEEDALDLIARHERVPIPAYPPLSKEHRDLMLALLSRDPAVRPTAAEAAGHRYFRDVDFARLNETRPPPLRAFVGPTAASADTGAEACTPAAATEPASAKARRLLQTVGRSKRAAAAPAAQDSLPLASSAAYDDAYGGAPRGAASARGEPPLVLPEVDVSSASRPNAGVALDDFAAASAVAEEQLSAALATSAPDAGPLPPLAMAASFPEMSLASSPRSGPTPPTAASVQLQQYSGDTAHVPSPTSANSTAPPPPSPSPSALFNASVAFAFFDPFGDAPGAAPASTAQSPHTATKVRQGGGANFDCAAAVPLSSVLEDSGDGSAQIVDDDGPLRGDALLDVLAAIGGCCSTDP